MENDLVALTGRSLREHLEALFSRLGDRFLGRKELLSWASQIVPGEKGLALKEGRLAFWPSWAKEGGLAPLALDFDGEVNRLKKSVKSIRKEPFARALGVKGSGQTLVWDLTVGPAGDSLLALVFGAQVVGFERSPVVASLLADALFRARSPEVMDRLQLVFGDVREASLPGKAHVAYLDPMWPLEKKKALPKKEMQLLRKEVGADEDVEELLTWACANCPRVVLKRPPKAHVLLKPNHQVLGKTARYDVYLGTQ